MPNRAHELRFFLLSPPHCRRTTYFQVADFWSDRRHWTEMVRKTTTAAAALRLAPAAFATDLKTFGFFFESLAVRDLRVYAAPLGGTVSHYRDRYGLEADAVLHLEDGRYALRLAAPAGRRAGKPAPDSGPSTKGRQDLRTTGRAPLSEGDRGDFRTGVPARRRDRRDRGRCQGRDRRLQAPRGPRGPRGAGRCTRRSRGPGRRP